MYCSGFDNDMAWHGMARNGMTRVKLRDAHAYVWYLIPIEDTYSTFKFELIPRLVGIVPVNDAWYKSRVTRLGQYSIKFKTGPSI